MSLPQPVAIVGIGGIFPGARNLDEFWNIIESGFCTSKEVPKNRWSLSVEDAYEAGAVKPDKAYSFRGCFVDDLADSDYKKLEKFGFDIKFLKELDPLYIITLLAGTEAYSDAVTDKTDHSKTGIIIGNIALPTEKSSAISWEIIGNTFSEKAFGEKLGGINTNLLNRYVTGLPAGLLAKALGLGGGIYTVDAACASSLYAIKLGIDELISGRADMMLSGGVSRPDCLYTQMGFSQLNAVSPNGICSPFDEKCNGLVVGEGAGILALKRLDDALRHGDKIYGVIKGIGLSNDIDGNLLAPSSEGQIRSMMSAYEQAGWDSQDVDIIECHATGTPVGDAVEFESLSKIREGSDKKSSCVLSSVKSNIGHLLTGAGAAGMIKVILSMKNKTLPPTANFSQPSSKIDLKNSPFKVLKSKEQWKRRDAKTPRRAAVSAFGFGGINAHVLVEEFDPASVSKSSSKNITKITQPVAIVGIAASAGGYKSASDLKKKILSGKCSEPAKKHSWFGADKSDWFKERFSGEIPFNGYGIEEVNVKFGQFRIPPKELEEMLPQQLLMLETAANALVDSGLDKVNHEKTGTFIGIGLDLNTTNFHVRWNMKNKVREEAKKLGINLTEEEFESWVEKYRDIISPPLNANRTMGALGSIVASRIAREFRFGGPSFALSSEESSGLRAVEAAARRLQENEIDIALAGAVDFAGDIRALISAYGSNDISDELLFGEGAYAFVLKRLDDAVKDKNKIYAVISGFSAASGKVDDAVIEKNIKDALVEAKVSIGEIGYIEKSGSINSVTADAEEKALNNISSGKIITRNASDFVGYSGAASGAASLYRAVKSIGGGVIPASKNNELGFSWLTGKSSDSKKVIVNSSGTGENFVTAVVESYYKEDKIKNISKPLFELDEAIFVVKADSSDEFINELNNLDKFIRENSDNCIFSLAGSWHRRQQNNKADFVVSFIAGSIFDLQKKIEFAVSRISANSKNSIREDGIYYSPARLAKRGKVAFVFPGSGNHYAGMGRDICFTWPGILKNQAKENKFLKDQILPEYFWEREMLEDIDKNHTALIFGQVTFGTIVSDLLRSFGVSPNSIIGYSLGETAGLFSMRVWNDRDIMLERINKSTLFTDDLAGKCLAAKKSWGLLDNDKVSWSIGVANVSSEKVKSELKDRKRVYHLITNTPDECVIGGDKNEVEKLVSDLGCNFVPVEGVTTVHCEVAGQVAKEYEELHVFDTSIPENIDFYSCALGRKYVPDSKSAAKSILQQALSGFDYPQLINNAYEDGVRVFIEIGPGASCTRMIDKILAGKDYIVASASIPGESEIKSILNIIALLISEGAEVNLDDFYSDVQDISEDKKSAKRIVVSTGSGEFIVPEFKKPERIVVENIVKQQIPVPVVIAENPVIAPEYISTSPELNPVVAKFESAQIARAGAHDAYLRLSSNITGNLAKNLAFQMNLASLSGNTQISDYNYTPIISDYTEKRAVVEEIKPANMSARDIPVLDRNMCMEFAIGSIAKVLGEKYAEIDSHSTRVRLPDEPLMLVDRIMKIEGEPCSLESGRVITEHDVLPNAWYLDNGRIPTCIAVEAGQADLFLSGYLGIDFKTKGFAVYRLLDAVVTFYRDLPRAGDIIRYDIRIDHFFRQGDTYLFKFNFESTVNGEPLISMKNGCAGFFTQAELEAGRGIIHTELDLRQVPGKKPDDWENLVPMSIEAYSDDQLDALRKGDLAGCFGTLFENIDVKDPLTIPGGKMKLADRVLHVDPNGGRFGLGLIRAEADIHPDDWFLTCHFCDDNVMPGTLMYECCMHTLRIFLLRMGWVASAADTVWQPIPGIQSQLKCRGQVIDSTKKAAYEISIKELGYNPEPYAIADALMYADGKPIVEIINMTIRLTGATKESIKKIWDKKKALDSVNTGICSAKPAIFNNDRILSFAVGKPSDAFGDKYEVFDSERIIARLPGPPYKFLDGITKIENCRQWQMTSGGEIEAQYKVPADEWYFDSNRQSFMPFSVLLEIALQPCGWLAAYLGSALTSDIDLSFRNLGGSAVQYAPISRDAGILTTKVKITKVSSSGGMIVQNYDFEMFQKGRTVYKGDTYFGFFSKDSLANQVGIRDAAIYIPTPDEIKRGRAFDFPVETPFPDNFLRMIDRVEAYIPDGGPNKLGFIRGTMDVNPDSWFFKAHFYQDPVCPGSLGVESFLQLLKVAAVERWGAKQGDVPFTVIPGAKHKWVYRGQIIPKDKKVTVDAWITSVDDKHKVMFAEGFLSVDGRIIYHLKDFSLIMWSNIK